MSHIRRTSEIDISDASPELLEQGLQIVAAMLEMQGVKVTDYFYNYDSRVSGTTKGVEVAFGLDAEGMTRRGKFGGIGVGINKKDKSLSFLGTSEEWDGSQANQQRQRKLQEQVEDLLPGAVYLAARAAQARAKGKEVEVNQNPQTGEMNLAIQEAV
ncbi:MAG: hypothetical protein ABEJ24_04565 [Candidatus Magasanikbacteria bacterium]